MCNIDSQTQARLMDLGFDLITNAMEAAVREDNFAKSTDVLGAATQAYQQGKITKTQLMGVINALDEQTYQSRAYAEPEFNREWREANAYLNQYRR